MHDTALQIGALVFERYLPPRKTRVLEIGSYDVNGSLRDHAPRTAKYVGLDFEAGKGVDHVVDDCDTWPVEDGSFDLVAASSVFEHDGTFWRTFLAMCRKAKAGGFIYIGAPSNGGVHRFPLDCWRFYPDAGRALEKWGQDNGFDITLIESFVADRKVDTWNDFCAVFQLGPTKKPLNTSFVYERLSAFNVTTWRSPQLLNDRAATEDMCLLSSVEADAARWQGEADALGARLQEHTHQWEGERERTAAEAAEMRREVDRAAEELAERNQKAASLDRELAANRAALADLEQDVADKEREAAALRVAQAELGSKLQVAVAEADTLDAARHEHLADLQTLRGEAALLQNRLAQRDEEASQAWARVHEAEERHVVLEAEIARTGARLADAEQWVSTLAKGRAELERQHDVTVRREKAYEQGKAIADQRIENLEAALAAQRRDDLTAELAEARAMVVEAEERAADLIETTSVEHGRFQDQIAALQLEGAAQLSRLKKLEGERTALRLQLEGAGHSDQKIREVQLELSAIKERHEQELRSLNAASDAQIAALRASMPVVEERHARERAALEAKANKLLSDSQRRSTHDQELARVEREAMQAKIERVTGQAEWLRAIARFLLEQQKSWWFALPKSQLERTRARALQQTGLFDSDSYLARYPDVGGSGQEPIRHYLAHGIEESRTANEQRQVGGI